MKFHLNKEVFLIAEDEMNTVELAFHHDMFEALEHLQTLNPLDNSNTKVYHGILAPAEVLPSSIKGKKCFIVVIDLATGLEGIALEGCVFESDCDNDISVLAEEVEFIIKDNEYVIFPVDIENIFILYGYPVEVTLGISDEGLDEEDIDTCKKIISEVNEMCEELSLGDHS